MSETFELHSPLRLPDERDPQRRAIVQAMARLFEGTPRRVAPGRISVSALAEEADIPRNHLNRQFDDLREKFLGIVAEATRDKITLPPTPERVAELEALVADQAETIEALRATTRDWKIAAEVFLRKNQAQTIDIANLERKIINHIRRDVRQQEKIQQLQAATRNLGTVTPIRRE